MTRTAPPRPAADRHDPRWRRPAVRVWLLTGIVAAAAAATAASAAGFMALDLRQRLGAAQEAAVGVVADVDVVLRDGEPWTLVTLEVERWWRVGGQRVGSEAANGPGLPPSLTAAFWGGRAPGAPTLQVAGVPTFAQGERVLWLLRASDEGLGAPTVGVTQGVWRAVAGAWQGDDGSRLGTDENGDLTLDGTTVPDEELFAALDAAFDDLEGAP